jgi:hypothetical protein
MIGAASEFAPSIFQQSRGITFGSAFPLKSMSYNAWWSFNQSRDCPQPNPRQSRPANG